MINLELRPITEEWIEREKEEIHRNIRQRRVDAMELMQKVPVTETIQLVVYINQLNLLEYILIKGVENNASKQINKKH